MNICTIIAKNYLAHARVLARSFAEHHPDGTCFVLIIDETAGYVDDAEEPFTLVRPDQIGLEAFDQMRAAYDVMELSTAVKPWLLRHMLQTHDDGSGVAYMDPDIRVTSRMTELEAELREHAIVLTPHVLHGMPRDGKRPNEADILMAGVYNLGFIGLSDRPDAHTVLDWWSERLLTDCYVAPERGYFVDQRWVDFVPSLVSDLEIFRHPAYNVAYWNLPERRLTREPDGSFSVNGVPLRFFHFSGYSPERRLLLSKHQNRIELSDDETLWEICSAYGDALEADGFHEVRSLPYEHDVLPSGLRLTHSMRTLYREAVEAREVPESLFTAAGEAEFLRYLADPSPQAPAVSRFLHGLWRSRPDLQQAYPGVPDGDVDGYIGWCAAYGRDQVGIPEVLIPAEFRTIEAAPATLQVTADAPVAPSTLPLQIERPYGVNVAGYLRSELGIGEVARQMIAALDAAGVTNLPVGLVAPGSRQGHGYAAATHDRNPFPVNLVCVNADGLPGFAQEAGESFFADRYTIGVWWWETSEFPERYHDAFRYVDEIWVGSRFIAQTLQTVSPVPVIHVPIPVVFPEPPPLAPGELDWPDAYTYLFSWDYHSVFKRKNPLAVVEAYTQAFGPDEGAALVLKCINHQHHRERHRELRSAIAGRPDIVLIDDYLDPADKDRLMRSCDCYVSLHRSEGLGLTMAEALFHGKPVIATDYSGNTDFMTVRNSFPVGYTPVAIGPDAEPYPPDGQWAEPDVAEAARLMRHVFEDRADAAAKGIQAALDMRERYSVAAAGAVMQRRLVHINPRVPGNPPPAPDGRLDETGVHRVRTLLGRAGRPARPSRFGKPGAAARRLVLRAMRPYTAYQNEMNASIEHALASAAAQTEAVALRSQATAAQVDLNLAASHASLLAQLRTQQATIERLTHAVAHGGGSVNGNGSGPSASGDAMRRQLAMTRAFERQMEQMGGELSERLRPAERLVAEINAVPYMSSDVFGTFDAGPAGTVFGFREGMETSAGDGYRAFEDLFRGPEDFIADRQRRYLDIVDGHAPAVDLGCGRGEFLDLLAERGIEAVGVDADAGMVARCREKGHADTVHGDGLEYLASRDDASLGLVFSAQVVEHLPPDVLTRLLQLAAQKLRPGGLFIAETVNPHSVPAMKAFWVDITHQHPLFPEAMLAFARIAGFADAYVFHPNGSGDVAVDRHACGEYALVARR